MSSTLRIGVDFDNTIVCHNRAFHRAAVEQGWIGPSQTTAKGGLRDRLRAAGREDEWTRIQGHVYGPGMVDAIAFPGAIEFFRRAIRSGTAVFIVSHRTRHPYAGPSHDLHEAALKWLENNGIFDPAGVGLDRACVYLEASKGEKLARIGALECTHFIDDLPELLGEPGFPERTERLLFDPEGQHPAVAAFRRVHSWDELAKELLTA